MIFLDYNSTTPVLPEVWEAMRPYAVENWGNPASSHHFGRKARQALDDSREQIAHLLGAFPDEVIFTSGATEANNLAIFGCTAHASLKPTSSVPCVLASPVEHPCVTEPLKQLCNWQVEYLPVDRDGIISVDAYRERLRPETQLAIVMLVNHEVGAIQPIRALNAVSPGVRFHTDAAQAVGKISVDFHCLGVSSLSASGHKFGGPKGAGLLLLRRGENLQPQLFGGHQQQGRRPGTENVAAAVGLARALELVERHREQSFEKITQMRQYLIGEFKKFIPTAVINGPEQASPYVLNIAFPGCRAELLLMKLDLAGVACSTGSACSSGSLLPSPVLQAMRVPDEVLRSAMRFSFHPSQKMEQIQEAARRIIREVKSLS